MRKCFSSFFGLFLGKEMSGIERTSTNIVGPLALAGP